MIIKNYISGQFVTGTNSFSNINPVDGKLVAEVSEASESLVDQAVAAARQALKGEWGQMPVNARCDLLHAVADGIQQRFDDFVEAEIADTGKPLEQARINGHPPWRRQFQSLCRPGQKCRQRMFRDQHAGWRCPELFGQQTAGRLWV